MEIIVVVLVAAAAVAAVLLPVLRRSGKEPQAPGRGPGRSRRPPVVRYDSNAHLDDEVERYRAARRAGTVCLGCRFANPPGSRFCAECGRKLPGSDPVRESA